MIFSVHIPKTAGTSFRRALEERYGSKLALYYGVKDPKTTESLRVPRRALLERAAGLEAQGFTVLHGHYALETVKPLITDPSAQVWTWLRDPVERTLSHFDFYRERKLELAKLAVDVRSGDVGLEQFMKLKAVRDLQSRYLAGYELAELGFVGVTEQFELGLALLFGKNAPQLNRRYNATEGKAEVGAALRARIARSNASDMMLYAEGLRLFVDRLADASAIAAPKRPEAAGAGLMKRLVRRVA